MTETQRMREHLFGVIMERVDRNEDRRREALTEYLLVTGRAAEGAAERVAELVPPVLPELYAKWVNLFLDRLFEMVPAEQIEILADGSEENGAAAIMAYLMFLESERMEKQVAEDLAGCGLRAEGDAEQASAGFIRERMADIARELRERRTAKAEAYKRDKSQ